MRYAGSSKTKLDDNGKKGMLLANTRENSNNNTQPRNNVESNIIINDGNKAEIYSLRRLLVDGSKSYKRDEDARANFQALLFGLDIKKKRT